MTFLKNTGLILGLSLSALLSACGDDDGDDGSDERDSSVRSDAGNDSGVRVDAGLDAAAPLDSSVALDSATPSDAATPADASTTPAIFGVTLTSAAETPPCSGAGSTAIGSATVTVVGETIALTITYSGLSGPVQNGHIHYGPAGANGPVVVPFGTPLESPIVRTLTAANYTPMGAAPSTFAAFLTDLKAGKTYLNLHTSACAAGEVRAQIQ